MKYFKYENYRNVRSQKIKNMLKQDVRQAKDDLKQNQSISKKMSSVSRFSKYKNTKSTLKKTLKNKISSMIVALVNIF